MEAITMFALPAGNDVEMGGGSFSFKTIPQLVQSGRLSIDIVDQAVSRVVRAKFSMGLFEQPYRGVAASELSKYMHTTEAVKLAKQLDTESIVLLENRKNVLPLKKSANIAVIGPMADFMNVSFALFYIKNHFTTDQTSADHNSQYGDYVVFQSALRGVTPLKAIRTASAGRVTYAKGCERWSNDISGIGEAVKAAQNSDVAVVVVGTWSRDQNELWAGLNATTGEHVDVSTLNLYGAMSALVKAIVDTGKPTIVVYSSGKPVTEPWISEHATALVQQFYPSEEGGNALASILYGDVNPSGKLAVSFPHDVGTLPVFYDYLNSGRSVDAGEMSNNGSLRFGHQYVTNTPEPLYEFGYGKSYTTFGYSNVTLDSHSAQSTSNDSITATVRVTNTGWMDGAEVVQLYIQDVIASVVVPNKSLKGFKKVFIRAGESVDVSIAVKVQDLGLWDVRMRYVVEPGAFVFWAGASSKDLRSSATLVVR
jgi:beta-glucosidase